MILDALGDALDNLEQSFGTTDMSQYRWGMLHRVTLKHPMGGSVSELNNGGEDGEGYPAPGANGTVNVASCGVSGSYTFSAGPSVRFIAEMIPDAIKTAIALPGGQSGDKLSSHYDDMMKLWVKGEYIDMPYYDDEVKGALESHLVFKRQK